ELYGLGPRMELGFNSLLKHMGVLSHLRVIETHKKAVFRKKVQCEFFSGFQALKKRARQLVEFDFSLFQESFHLSSKDFNVTKQADGRGVAHAYDLVGLSF